MNKKLVLLIFVLCVSLLLTGCSEELPEGIESRTFFNDLDRACELLLISMADNTYYEEEIGKIFGKMNEEKYKEKLNDYELLILETLNSNLNDIERDLTTGDRIITSITFEKIEWILDIMDEHWKKQNPQ